MNVVKFFNQIFKNDFYKKVLQGFLGNFSGLLLPILFLPFVTRFYSPIDYGEFALFNTSYLLFSIICTGMYSSAILKETNDILALNLLVLSLVISFIVCLLISLILLCLSYIQYVQVSRNFWIFFFIPILILLFGFSTSLSSWLQRAEKIKQLSFATILISISTSFFTLIFGYLKFGYIGLVYSLLISQIIYSSLLLRYFIKYNNINLSEVRIKYIFVVAAKHIDFPKYNLVLGLFDGLSDNIIVYSISTYFGSTILGQYTFAKNLVMRPLQLIVSSVNNLYYRRLVIMKAAKENYFIFTKNLLLSLIVLVVPFCLLLLTLGNNLFSFLFGTNWQLAASISMVLLPKIVINYINGSISSTPLVFNKLMTNTIFSTLNNFIPIIFFIVVSYFFNNFFYSFASYSLVSFISGILLFSWYIKLLRFF